MLHTTGLLMNLRSRWTMTTLNFARCVGLAMLVLSLAACEMRVRSSVEQHHDSTSTSHHTPTFEGVPDPPADPLERLEDPSHIEGVLVLMHGYNSNHQDFERVAELAATRGFAALSVPAPIQNAPSRYQWERDDLEATHQYIQKNVQRAFKGVDGVPRERVWVSGFSQGGLYAALLTATYPESYRGALAIAPAGWASIPTDAAACPDASKRPGKVVVVTGENEVPRYAEKTALTVKMLERCEMLDRVITHSGAHSFPGNWQTSFAEVFTGWTTP